MLKGGVLHKHFNRVNLALTGSEASLSSTRCRQLPEADEYFVKSVKFQNLGLNQRLLASAVWFAFVRLL